MSSKQLKYNIYLGILYTIYTVYKHHPASLVLLPIGATSRMSDSMCPHAAQLTTHASLSQHSIDEPPESPLLHIAQASSGMCSYLFWFGLVWWCSYDVHVWQMLSSSGCNLAKREVCSWQGMLLASWAR